MKKLWFVLGMTSLIILSSCSEDKIVSNTRLVKSINITGQDFQSEDTGTKAAYTVDGTGFHFSWTEGDTVGIYPVGGDQVAFPISSGEGSQTAQFDGGAWALRSSYSYAAYYPFNEGNYHVDATEIPVSFIGQTQNGNGSLDCLDRFDYQASVATCPDADGNVNIELKHLGCFVRFQFTMPIADTYTAITLTSSKTPFITSGTFDLTRDDIAITSKTTSPSITINLNNTTTTTDDKILNIFALLAPEDLRDSEIIIKIYGTTIQSYAAKIQGKNMMSGCAYSFFETIKSGTNVEGKDISWNDTNELNGFEYVDLGLSVMWATCNIGANKPEEYGKYYAWGETETKNNYAWTEYKYWIGDNYSAKYSKYNTEKKYGVVDNKTTLDCEDDVAHVNWGGSWRIPTKAEQEELLQNCSWIWTTINGVQGYLVASNKTGYTDRSIFFPAAGYYDETSFLEDQKRGNYWSSSLDTDTPIRSWILTFQSDYVCSSYDGGRRLGFPVRPVFISAAYYKVLSFHINQTNVRITLGGNPIQLNTTLTRKSAAPAIVSPIINWSSSDENVAIVDNDGNVTGVNEGFCVITASIGSIQSTCNIVVTSGENGYEYVDLGLSVKWATCNVGATRPEEYGDYYAWGETETKSSFDWSNYKYSKGNQKITKYCSNKYYGYNSYSDNRVTLELEDDVAHVKWGGKWRMPTEDEWEELIKKCNWTWTTRNGVIGCEFTSKQTGYVGKQIFIPAAGYRSNTTLYDAGVEDMYIGYYWSSSLCVDAPIYSAHFESSTREQEMLGHGRILGQTIRPVCP